MATTYHPLPRHRPMKWLLTDGRIVEEPPLETSDSGRRVRVVGDRKSVYQKELDDLIYRSVTQFASKNGERPWLRIVNDDPVSELNNELGAVTQIDHPHFITPQETSYYSRSSKLTWTFRHETLPIAARITVEMTSPGTRHYNRSSSREERVEVSVTHPSTSPYDAFERVWRTSSHPEGFSFSEHSDGSQDYIQQKQDFVDWLRNNLPEWTRVLGATAWANEREAAAGIARLCREIESFESITIPDLRDAENPDWLELKLHSTTYSSDFARSLIDFINGQPVVEQVAQHWNEIVTLLKRAGIVTKELQESDWHAAIQGQTERVEVTLGPIDAPNEDNGNDNQHILGVNLATGTLSVSCTVRDTRPEDVATDYEIARIKAEARGEIDAFLGFQSNFLNARHDERHQRIVEQRSVDPAADDLDDLLGIK